MAVNVDYRTANEILRFGLCASDLYSELADCPLLRWTETTDQPARSPRVGLTFDRRLMAVKTMIELIGAKFFQLHEMAQLAILARLRKPFARLSADDAESIRACGDFLYEAFIFSRLAYLGFAPDFVKAEKRTRTPDILLDGSNVWIECKNLSERDAPDGDISRVCKLLVKYASELGEKCDGVDPEGQRARVLCVDMPPAFGGYLRKLRPEHRLAAILAASGNPNPGFEGHGTPGHVRFLFTETTVIPTGGKRFAPAERWYGDFSPVGKDTSDRSGLKFYWQLMLRMGRCPMGACEFPTVALMQYGIRREDRVWARPGLVRTYWEQERRALNLDDNWLDMPPMAMFPTRGEDGSYSLTATVGKPLKRTAPVDQLTRSCYAPKRRIRN